MRDLAFPKPICRQELQDGVVHDTQIGDGSSRADSNTAAIWSGRKIEGMVS